MTPTTPRTKSVRSPKAPRVAPPSLDVHYSSYREMLIEHLFIAEVMRSLWLRGIARFEVLKPQVDDSGYDLVFEANGITRHVQLKSSSRTATTALVKASLGLGKKPSGCLIWVRFDPTTLDLGPFYWFGGKPGKPLPDIREFKIGKHTKGNAQGIKKERPNTRIIPRAKFEPVDDVSSLVSRLFGKFADKKAPV